MPRSYRSPKATYYSTKGSPISVRTGTAVASATTPLLLVLASGTVILGKWAAKEKLDFRLVTGLVVIIVLITILDVGAPEVARPLAALALVAAILTYGTKIFTNLKGGK